MSASSEERAQGRRSRRWSRDNRILIAIGVGLGAALTALYALVLKTRALTPAAATNRVLLFVLFYIVVLLILTLLFVIGRSAAKLVLDSKRGVFGTRFRVRVVVTHVGLAMLPIALLLIPTTGLLQESVERWFRQPVAQTMHAGQAVTELVRRRAAQVEKRAADRLVPLLLAAESDDTRFRILSDARETSGLDYLEWRAPGAAPVAVSSPAWPLRDAKEPSREWLADATARGAARRLESTSGGGQIGRTVVVAGSRFLVLGTFDPPAEAAPILELARATSTYAMLEAERASLEALQVLLFLLLASLVLLASVWAGLLLARRVTRPIAALASSARRVGAGDFDARVPVEAEDEFGALSRTFNAMTAELSRSREGIVAANAELVATNRRLDEERRRVRTILAHLDAGVVAFRDDHALLATNEAARRLLGARETAGPDTLDELLAEPALAPLREFIDRAVELAGPREAVLNLLLPSGAPCVVETRISRVAAHSGETASWVLTLEDTTALVKAERAAAWREAAQRMAHEIKNPLTPIRLAAERMSRRARLGGASGQDVARIVEEGAATIVEEVGTLAALVDAFGRFARLPAAELQETDLAGVVAQVTKLYDGVRPGVKVSADLAEGLPPVRADAEQIKRALINLVDNAVAASPPGGNVVLLASVAGGRARLEVADDGPGIPAADRARVFDPDFTTKSRGTGLGLAITARIAAEHSGRVSVEENVPRGCRFVIEWPAA